MSLVYKRTFTIALTFLILAGMIFSFPKNVHAGTYITVTTKVDAYQPDGNCSLREAIVAANTNKAVDKCPAGSASSMDTIYIPSGNYILQPFGQGKEDQSLWGDLDILDGVFIYGDGFGKTIIDGSILNDRVFQIIKTTNAFDVYISGLEIRNGFVGGSEADARGGGIFNKGAVLHLNGVLLDGNRAANTGGNLDNDAGSTMYITRSIVRQGSAGHGGGIYNLGTLVVSESQLTGNLANETGGAIDNNTTLASLTLVNTTVGQNTATRTETTSGGAGIFNEGKVQITNSTIANNYGIGLVIKEFSTGTILNTIFAGNVNGNCVPGINAIGLKDQGHNLIDTIDCPFLGAGTGDIKVANFAAVKMANALTNEGGLTMAYALQPGSPAIDAGTVVNDITVDQRLFKRPADGDGNGTGIPDIGAFEFGASKGGIYLPVIRR